VIRKLVCWSRGEIIGALSWGINLFILFKVKKGHSKGMALYAVRETCVQRHCKTSAVTRGAHYGFDFVVATVS
jgi:hypothetical protein